MCSLKNTCKDKTTAAAAAAAAPPPPAAAAAVRIQQYATVA